MQAISANSKLIFFTIIVFSVFVCPIYSQENPENKKVVISSVDYHPKIMKLKSDYELLQRQYLEALAANNYSPEEMDVLQNRALKAFNEYKDTRDSFVEVRKNTTIDTDDILIFNDTAKIDDAYIPERNKQSKTVSKTATKQKKINKDLEKLTQKRKTPSQERIQDNSPSALRIKQMKKNEEMKLKMLMIMKSSHH